MKKITALLLLLLIVVIACIYLLIPGTLTVNLIASVPCSSSGANRTLIQKSNWKKFWQGNYHINGQNQFADSDFYLFQEDTFRVTQLLQKGMQISISNGKSNMNSNLLVIPSSNDTTLLNWHSQAAMSLNPLIRLLQYRQILQTKESMAAVLSNMKSFLSNDKNIYGITIKQSSTNDTTLVSTKTIANTYPSTAQVYSMISRLQAYIKEHGAIQTGNPMLNVTQIDSNTYAVMTAVPTNKILPENGPVTYKRMVPGKFLTAVVEGGEGNVKNAYAQMQLYVQDYNRTVMAIPFMYLLTDRSNEQDTSKWMTSLYFPVM